MLCIHFSQNCDRGTVALRENDRTIIDMTGTDHRLEMLIAQFRLWAVSEDATVLQCLADRVRHRVSAADRLDRLTICHTPLDTLERLERRTGRQFLLVQVCEFIEKASDGWERERFVELLTTYATNVEGCSSSSARLLESM